MKMFLMEGRLSYKSLLFSYFLINILTNAIKVGSNNKLFYKPRIGRLNCITLSGWYDLSVITLRVYSRRYLYHKTLYIVVNCTFFSPFVNGSQFGSRNLHYKKLACESEPNILLLFCNGMAFSEVKRLHLWST
jgi:hypothetical protein